jgi:hypothetical protein
MATMNSPPPLPPELTPLPLSDPNYRLNPHVQSAPIRLRNFPNFDGDSGKARTFLNQLNTFTSQWVLFPDHGHKVAYAVSLLTDGAAKWAMGSAASPQGYFFNSLEEFNVHFCQQFFPPVSALGALPHILEIKQKSSQLQSTLPIY